MGTEATKTQTIKRRMQTFTSKQAAQAALEGLLHPWPNARPEQVGDGWVIADATETGDVWMVACDLGCCSRRYVPEAVRRLSLMLL